MEIRYSAHHVKYFLSKYITSESPLKCKPFNAHMRARHFGSGCLKSRPLIYSPCVRRSRIPAFHGIWTEESTDGLHQNAKISFNKWVWALRTAHGHRRMQPNSCPSVFHRCLSPVMYIPRKWNDWRALLYGLLELCRIRSQWRSQGFRFPNATDGRMLLKLDIPNSWWKLRESNYKKFLTSSEIVEDFLSHG